MNENVEIGDVLESSANTVTVKMEFEKFETNKENIKIEVVRHTLFSLIMLLILLLSSIIETFFSTSILKGVIKYF